jgi:uncharacterized protein (TIGR02646 family)
VRFIERESLPLVALLALRRRQAACADAEVARAEWTKYRSSAEAAVVIETLKRMAKASERCFYCADSRGADIDHFNPISVSVGTTFQWQNLLLVCTPCNRQKASKSPYIEGRRGLVDPTRDVPWHHFVYVDSTGLLAPRFDRSGNEDFIGSQTLNLLSVLNHDAIADGRKRAARRLRRAAEQAVAAGAAHEQRRDLLHAVEDDPYGLARWYTAEDGRLDDPFATLAGVHPRLWRRFCAAATR